MAKMKECPECGIRVKLENLESHLRKVHPRAKVEVALTEKDKTAIKIAVKKEKKRMAPFEDREKRRWAIAGIIVSILVIVAIIVVMILAPNPGACELRGKEAPSMPYMVDVDGNGFIFEDHIGDKPLVFEFFYTGCQYCIDLVPELEALNEHYGYGEEVQIVSFSGDQRDSLQEVRNFRDSHGANWTFIKGPPSVAVDYCIEATPTVVIIDKTGVVRQVLVGFHGVNTMINSIDPYL